MDGWVDGWTDRQTDGQSESKRWDWWFLLSLCGLSLRLWEHWEAVVNASWPCRVPFAWLPDLRDLAARPLPAQPAFPPTARLSPEPSAAGKAALLLEKLSPLRPLGLTCRGEQRKNRNEDRVTKPLLHDTWIHAGSS